VAVLVCPHRRPPANPSTAIESQQTQPIQHLPGQTLRLVRALCIETHENWLEAHRYLNMDYLRELKKEALRKAA
jgi:hypothetical protein